MDAFSDAGSTPAVSSTEGRAAKLGLSEVDDYRNPTTVEVSSVMGFLFSAESARLFTKSAECAILTITKLKTGAFTVIKPIIRDVIFLSQKSVPAAPDDRSEERRVG